MDWKEVYKSKLVSLEEAAGKVQPNDRVFCSTAGNIPKDLVNTLSRRLPELGFITFYSGSVLDRLEYLCDTKYKDYFKHYSIFLFAGDRECPNKENVEVYPINYSRLEGLLENEIKPNVMMMMCAPPDENGYFSFGPWGICNDLAARYADKIIVQVNNNIPYTYGQSSIHVSQVDYITEKDAGLLEIPPIPVTDVEKKVGEYIAERIEDGSTIQIGFGGLANAICSFLETKKDLGIHTELFVDGMVPLIQKGIINGSKKTLHPNEASVGLAGPGIAAVRFMHKNPMVKTYPINYINNPYVIAKNDNLVSVNNALMVDLTGQVGSESLGFKQFSSTGGQLDFVRGAGMSKNGQSFIAIPSCSKTRDGVISRIVLTLPPGGVVTTPRTDVDKIVTEYGVAELKNKSIRERVMAMITIAHPQYRDELFNEARKVGLLL